MVPDKDNWADIDSWKSDLGIVHQRCLHLELHLNMMHYDLWNHFQNQNQETAVLWENPAFRTGYCVRLQSLPSTVHCERASNPNLYFNCTCGSVNTSSYAEMNSQSILVLTG